MKLCDALEAQLTAATNTRCALLEATLHEALTSGEISTLEGERYPS